MSLLLNDDWEEQFYETYEQCFAFVKEVYGVEPREMFLIYFFQWGELKPIPNNYLETAKALYEKGFVQYTKGLTCISGHLLKLTPNGQSLHSHFSCLYELVQKQTSDEINSTEEGLPS